MKLEDRILKYLPLLAPVPTAWLVGVATFTLMHFPLPVAVIAALIIEGLGFVAVNTAMQMREYNRRLKADEIAKKMQAPVGQAYAATALYMVVATIMTVLLHVFPSMVAYAPIPFVLMTVAGAWLFALRSDFDEKVKERDAGRTHAKQERADKKKARVQAEQVARKQGVQVTSKASKLQGASDKLQVQVARKLSKQDEQDEQARKQPVQDEALLAYWSDKPKASDGEVAEQFGKSRQAIQQRREKLITRGAIRMNDQGVEIIGIPVGTKQESIK